jgi:galactokinase
MMLADRVREEFQNRFHMAPSFVVRAPGRVNLIGEHTDYNDGFVLPMAIDRAVWIALRPRHDMHVSVRSLDFDEVARFDLQSLAKNKKHWAEYIKGTAWVLQDAGYILCGWEGVIAGDIPIGAGLSSSAAMEMASARAFAAVSGLTWEPVNMARLGQRAENKWIGVNCGIMDEAISANGREGHAMLIDCRTLDMTPAPLPPQKAVMVLDTATRRGLVDSAYNERRAQCEAAAQFFGVRALRDVTPTMFEVRGPELDELTRRRARHVITENKRTLQAVKAMQRGEAGTLGTLMNASHESLRDDFEVSSDALNAIVECARRQPGCCGARMTGAGFGGCAVALVDAGESGRFVSSVAAEYQQATGKKPNIYVCKASDGAAVVG